MNQTGTDAGYSISEGILSSRECASITNALRDRTERRAGIRNLLANPAVAALASDQRLLNLAKEILGTDVVPFRATLFEKSGTANWHVLWHQDRALPLTSQIESGEWGPWTRKAGVLYGLAPAWALERVVALRISLDASTESNGPLRVIPGSHKRGVLAPETISQITKDQEPETCIVGQGGVLAMRPLLLHSSIKASSREARRVIHLEYARSLDLGVGIRLCVS